MRQALLAVLPSFFLTGPLALLALLFPAAFAGLSLWLKRYKLLLTTISIGSLIYLVHSWWLRARWKDSFLGDKRLPWLLLALVSLALLPWAWRRRPNRQYSNRPSGECIGLALVAVLCLSSIFGSAQPLSSEVAWIFEMPEPGTIVSSPCVHEGRLYVAAAIDTPTRQSGRVYCLDAITGKQIWGYDDAGTMKPVFSSPVCFEGTLYIGEGFHRDANCRLHAIDLAQGTKQWTFPTSSHVESTPLVHAGRIYFGAGDAGLYCVDAETGKELWHFAGGHVDASPALSMGCVVFGSTRAERYELLACDATTGAERWRLPCDMPVVGSPMNLGDKIAVGIGRGNYVQSGTPPGGELWIVDSIKGEELWRLPLPDAVLARPAGTAGALAFACRDGKLRMADCTKRTVTWEKDLSAPLLAAPILDDCVMQLNEKGLLTAIDARSGKQLWQFDSGARMQSRVEALATPAIWSMPDGMHRIYIACGAKSPVRNTAVVICLTRESLR